MSLIQDMYERLGPGEYLDVSKMHLGREKIKVITEDELGSLVHVEGIKIATDNVENYIQALNMIWGPAGQQYQPFIDAINIVRNMTNSRKTLTSMNRYSYTRSPRQYGSTRSPRQYGSTRSPRQYGSTRSPRQYGSTRSPQRYSDNYPTYDYSRYYR